MAPLADAQACTLTLDRSYALFEVPNRPPASSSIFGAWANKAGLVGENNGLNAVA
jgi:hypothetical protein